MAKLASQLRFLIEILIEVIVDSHAVVRNNTALAQFPLVLTFCRNIVQHCNSTQMLVHSAGLRCPDCHLYSGVCVYSTQF